MICMLDEDDNGTLNFTEFQKLLQYISKWKVCGIAQSALHVLFTLRASLDGGGTHIGTSVGILASAFLCTLSAGCVPSD